MISKKAEDENNKEDVRESVVYLAEEGEKKCLRLSKEETSRLRPLFSKRMTPSF